jgi:thymidylate synthase
MKIYNDLLREIMEHGIDREGRNGWTRGLFVRQLRFDLSKGFPAVTTKKLAFGGVAAELLCFMSGCSDNNVFTRLGCKVWTDNAEDPKWTPKAAYPGDLGRVYGKQWREWKKPDGTTVDQLQEVIETIKKDPYNRRLVVSAWNPGEMDQMTLPPCHMLFHFSVANEKLYLHMVQRSCDTFLGVPFNIASYSLMLHLVAQMTNLQVGEFIHTLDDVHIYHNHFDAVKEQLSREPYPLPKLWINPSIKSLADIDVSKMNGPEDVAALVRLEDYKFHPPIKAKMSV